MDQSRRDILGGLALPLAMSPAVAQPLRPLPQRRAPAKKFVALQIGARSFVDEGVDDTLDTLQRVGGVNVVMAAVFTYGGGLAGRQSRGQPFPDHGPQEPDRIHGGSYAAVHPEFYAGSVIKDVRAPDLGDFDILAEVIPRAKSRGMQTYALFEENYNPRYIPNFEQIAEIDIYGRVGRATCFNNPNARAYLASMVADWVTSNDLDGLMWESERQGPFNAMIGAHFGDMAPRRAAICCFCDHCIAKAAHQGLDGNRAREGYKLFDRWVTALLANRPLGAEGSFMPFWRLMTDYPEILGWHRFWVASQEEMYAHLYGTAKRIKPALQVGWHIMHLISMSPFFRADNDYARLMKFSDYLKPSTYNNCGGPRFADYIRNVQAVMYRDFTPEQLLDMHYRLLGLEGEPTLAQLPTRGMSANSVKVETARAVDGVGGAIPIYPGIDIDIPTRRDEKRTRPEDVRDATLAAYAGGAAGVVLSRKYAEMNLSNIAGAGEALRRMGISA
ncbi:hypothetical protein [Sphingomonas quercus]|uniref:Uncharacterized protein n=1 Tax=Sphingomonas quercus TaxID=2842451 RepID=A0ABS6BMJ4_9SPHN|nr:hypothetical protein [Sphingomonas quercus]MBU3079518.1 hypothetical protein [Sphingomonas quercus]